jgi:hypothetical protein
MKAKKDTKVKDRESKNVIADERGRERGRSRQT